MVGNDVIFGDGQDDTIVGGYGNDWISGGTGDDGILGDDGRIVSSRNGTAEPLDGIAASWRGSNTELTLQGGQQDVLINTIGTLALHRRPAPGQSRLDDHASPNDALRAASTRTTSSTAASATTAIHGGAGDDAISGAEALAVAYIRTATTIERSASSNATLIESDYTTRTTRATSSATARR